MKNEYKSPFHNFYIFSYSDHEGTKSTGKSAVKFCLPWKNGPTARKMKVTDIDYVCDEYDLICWNLKLKKLLKCFEISLLLELL